MRILPIFQKKHVGILVCNISQIGIVRTLYSVLSLCTNIFNVGLVIAQSLRLVGKMFLTSFTTRVCSAGQPSSNDNVHVVVHRMKLLLMFKYTMLGPFLLSSLTARSVDWLACLISQ